MVDPVSLSIGAVVTIASLLGAYGLYAAGQRPAHMVDMREVSNYYRRTAAAEALQQDIDDDEASMCDAVRDQLADRPPESWEDVNQDIVEEREEEAEHAQDEFAGRVEDAVRNLIEQDGFVEVSPPSSDAANASQ